MNITPIKTRIMHPPQDDLWELLDKYLIDFTEGDILVVTSKVVAIHQGRCVKIGDDIDKSKLIEQEAKGKIVPYTNTQSHSFLLTIAHNALLPSAGIDESNSDGYYTLLPTNLSEVSHDIWRYLCKRFNIGKCGIIITDSHSLPLRYGVVGIALGWWGIEPLRSYAGKKDLFGRTIKFSQSNIVDALSAGVVLVMGEGSESQPLCIVKDAKDIVFTNQDTMSDLMIEPKEDLYYPLLKIFEK